MNEIVLLDLKQNQNIHISINQLENKNKYRLIIENDDQIRIYQALRRGESFLFFGYIRRDRNEKTFDKSDTAQTQDALDPGIAV